MPASRRWFERHTTGTRSPSDGGVKPDWGMPVHASAERRKLVTAACTGPGAARGYQQTFPAGGVTLRPRTPVCVSVKAPQASSAWAFCGVAVRVNERAVALIDSA